tara:strand:+ start:629 stop:1132 length:504 start_codon:yes stop_codon:yes gene_type:complete
MNKDITKSIPYVVFKERVAGKWTTFTSNDVFQAGKQVVFSLPGAFTPTCSSKQLPNFERLYEEFKSKGIDEVYCISVNDSFVMNAWFDSLKVNNVKAIPDGNGHFTRRMGMLINKTHLGFGMRSWRYAMVVEDGQIIKWFEEEGINDRGKGEDPYVATDPENILKSL